MQSVCTYTCNYTPYTATARLNVYSCILLHSNTHTEKHEQTKTWTVLYEPAEIKPITSSRVAMTPEGVNA